MDIYITISMPNINHAFTSKDIYAPVVINEAPIGFIANVDNNFVTIYLWQKFMKASRDKDGNLTEFALYKSIYSF